MPRRGDTEQLDAVARESSLTRGGRVALGALVEAAKATAGGGTKNARGDFTVGELRGLAPDLRAPAVDRCLERDAAALGAEREVRALGGEVILEAGRTDDGALALRFATAVLRLPPAGWLLRADGVELARATDEPDFTLSELRRLAGRRVTRVVVRRRDGALLLEVEDDPFDAAYELLVRGARRRGAEPWELLAAG